MCVSVRCVCECECEVCVRFQKDNMTRTDGKSMTRWTELLDEDRSSVNTTLHVQVFISIKAKDSDPASLCSPENRNI